MNRDNALLVANIVDKITRLEKTIFELQQLTIYDTFVINGSRSFSNLTTNIVKLDANEIATVVFTQDILEYYINILNLELDELVKTLEEY